MSRYVPGDASEVAAGDRAIPRTRVPPRRQAGDNQQDRPLFSAVEVDAPCRHRLLQLGTDTHIHFVGVLPHLEKSICGGSPNLARIGNDPRIQAAFVAMPLDLSSN